MEDDHESLKFAQPPRNSALQTVRQVFDILTTVLIFCTFIVALVIAARQHAVECPSCDCSRDIVFPECNSGNFTKSGITTHILDTNLGKPAANVSVELYHLVESADSTNFAFMSSGITDTDGRVSNMIPAGQNMTAGTYKLVFHTKAYFDRFGTPTFFPEVNVQFSLPDPPDHHYHVPILLTPFGYSTYRGS
eukprot:TRINITY_DN1153_c0_g1::TRINITY_DN1153_c0_g1_i1::g.17309::m.17309 TRINITY_DN1153_c0_g1::TRINITY_DN1153_c0_g1_i1::g.17309  ORF type:complete len:205 (-),score=48.88,sp/Q92UG5/HIUH2_RHIME/44.00/6e-24,Transthyretin/PF00576.16/6.4e-36 TRINITY_DN1153_c0_g1_i1:661-1236(-)